MTVVTGILAGNMIYGFAGRGHAVMTGGAGTQHFEVIYTNRRRPQGRGLAGVTKIGRLDMRGVLAGCPHAIVTTLAIASDIGVIKIRRQPAISCVTVVAGFLAGYVARRLALGNHAVVA